MKWYKLKMLPHRYILKGRSAQNKRRIFHANYKNKETSRKCRKIIATWKQKNNKEDVDIY